MLEHGQSYRYMVHGQVCEQGLVEGKKAQRILPRLVAAAADKLSDVRPTLRKMMLKAMISCAACRNMGVQKVINLLLQVTSVDHGREFIRTSSATTSSAELPDPCAIGDLLGRDDPL